MTRQIMRFMPARQLDSWNRAHAQPTVLVAHLRAGVPAGLHLTRAGLGALHSHMVRVIWVAQPVPILPG